MSRDYDPSRNSRNNLKVRFISSDLAKIDLDTIREPRDLLLYVVFVYCSFVKFPKSLCLPLVSLVAVSTAARKGSHLGFHLRDKDWAPMVLWDDDKKVGAVKQQLRRYRLGIENWQIEHGKVLITIRRGRAPFKRDQWARIEPNDEGELVAEAIPTFYTLPVVTKALELIEENFDAMLEEARTGGLSKKLRSPLVKSILVQLNDRLGVEKVDPVQKISYEAKRKLVGSRVRNEIWRIVELANQSGYFPEDIYQELLQEIHDDLDGPVGILQKEREGLKSS